MLGAGLGGKKQFICPLKSHAQIGSSSPELLDCSFQYVDKSG